jgi:hypothetical protein
MKFPCAALLICFYALRSDPTLAKEMCKEAWGKGNYKTFKQIKSELQNRLPNAKILRLSLCGSDNNHYFQATILEAAGKVRVIQVPAH